MKEPMKEPWYIDYDNLNNKRYFGMCSGEWKAFTLLAAIALLVLIIHSLNQ